MRIQKKPEERRQEIINTSKRLFVEKGYQATQIKDIVGEMKVAHGLFYYYFSSKEDVFEAIACEFAESIVATIQNFIQNPIPPHEKIFGMFGIFLQTTEDEKSFYNLIPTMDSDIFHSKIYAQMEELLIPMIVDIVEEGNAAGMFHCAYPDQATQVLVRGIFSFFQTVPHEEKVAALMEHMPSFQTIICDLFGIDQGALPADPIQL